MPREQRLTALRTAFVRRCEDQNLKFGVHAVQVFDQVFHMQDMMFSGEQEPDELDSLTLLELITETMPARSLENDLSYIPVVGRELGRFMAARYPKRWPDLDDFLTDVDAFIASDAVNRVPKSSTTKMVQYALDQGFAMNDEASTAAFMEHFNALSFEERSAILDADGPAAPPLMLADPTTGEMWGSGQRRSSFLEDASPDDFAAAPQLSPQEQRDLMTLIDDEIAAGHAQMRALLGMPEQLPEEVPPLKDVLSDPAALLELRLPSAVLRLLAWVDSGEKNRRPVTSTLAVKPIHLAEVGELCGMDDATEIAAARRMDNLWELTKIWRMLLSSEFLVNDTAATVCCGSETREDGLLAVARAFDEQLRNGASPADAAAHAAEAAGDEALGRLIQFVVLWCVYTLHIDNSSWPMAVEQAEFDSFLAEMAIVLITGVPLLLEDIEVWPDVPQEAQQAGQHYSSAADAIAQLHGDAPVSEEIGSDYASQYWAITAGMICSSLVRRFRRLETAGLLSADERGCFTAVPAARMILLQATDIGGELSAADMAEFADDPDDPAA